VRAGRAAALLGPTLSSTGIAAIVAAAVAAETRLAVASSLPAARSLQGVDQPARLQARLHFERASRPTDDPLERAR
jgi:hypothetical protein